MIHIYDNLAATLIAGTILIMLVAVNHRTQQAQIESTIFYTTRNMQVNFIETLRRDIVGATRVKNVEEVESSSDTTFTFFSRVGADTTEIEITYKRTKAASRGDVDLYRIERYEQRPGQSSELSGASMSTLTGWRVVGQNEQGNKPDSPEDVHQLYIWFEATPPLGDDLTERRHWEATFRPHHLNSDMSL